MSISGQRPVDRTFFRDLDELGALQVRERPGEDELDLDVVDHPGARLTFGAVGRVDAPVLQVHRDRLERPAPSAGVQPDGHRGTRAQGGEEEVVRVRPAIRAAGRRRLIGRQPMRVDLDLLRKSLDAAMDDHVVHIVILACPVSAAMYSGASTPAVPPKKNASISSFCDSASVRPISMSGRV